VATAVLSPISISANQQHGDLTQAEYNRKQRRAAAGGPGGPGWPPTATTLGLGPSSPIAIPPGQISIFRRKPPAVIMPVEVKPTGQKIWVVAWQLPAGTRKHQAVKTVLGALSEILKEIQDKPTPSNKAENPAAKAVPVRLGSDVIGVFATGKDTAMKAAEGAIKDIKATIASS
jgi:hypothetical protein